MLSWFAMSVICNENLSGNSVKDGWIKCEMCGNDLVVKNVKIKENNILKKLLIAKNWEWR